MAARLQFSMITVLFSVAFDKHFDYNQDKVKEDVF